MATPIEIVGGGFAGAECAFQLAERGIPVVLWEMRPVKSTPVHKSSDFAELVCSNSFRSDDPHHAAGLLKREMETLGSLVLREARAAAVPAGSALAVDRDRFAARVTAVLSSHPLVEIRRGEVTALPEGEAVIATGPLTSEAMAQEIAALLGSDYLYFYDAIAPIVEADSLDMARLFWQSRYDKGDGADYLNVPMDRDEYLAFHQAVLEAEVVAPNEHEKAIFFEGCLPIEEMARRGVDTLRYGPMKPVGLRTPDGRRPYAVVQLRQENLAKSQLNLVGFQSRMKWGEQRRIFSTLPGFAGASFVRFGQIHRNTFINAPTHLDPLYRLKAAPRLRLGGQITGVEGYLESAATGLAIGLYLALERAGTPVTPFPATTALGAMSRHLIESDPKNFQPANINYGLFTELPERLRKGDRKAAYAARAQADLAAWAEGHGVETAAAPAAPAVPSEIPVGA